MNAIEVTSKTTQHDISSGPTMKEDQIKCRIKTSNDYIMEDQFKLKFAIFHQGFHHMPKGPRARRVDIVINAKAKPLNCSKRSKARNRLHSSDISGYPTHL